MRTGVWKTFGLLWVAHFYVDFAIGAWPIYKTLAGVNLATAGLIMGLAGLVGEFMQLPFGIISDQGHRKKVLIGGILLASSMSFISFGQSFIGMFLPVLLVMIGSGAFHPSGAGMALQLLPSKGKAALLFTAGGALGLGTSQIALSKIFTISGGHALIMLIPAALLVGVWIFHPLPSLGRSNNHRSIREIFTLFKDNKRPLGLLYLSQACSYGFVHALILLLPDLLLERNASRALAFGGGTFALVAGGATGMVGFGLVADRWGFRKSYVAIWTFAITMLASLFIFPYAPFLTACNLFLFGAAAFSLSPLLIAWGNHLVPGSPSSVSGLLMGVAWSTAALLPMLAGTIANQLPIGMSIQIMSFFLLIGITCALSIPRQEELIA